MTPVLRLAPSLVLAALFLMTAACINTGVVPTPVEAFAENPGQGITVRIADVTDDRVFQGAAAARLTPSLTGDENDPARRGQAIGRTSMTNGRPGANVFLAPGFTVQSVVGDAIERALREAGFRVASPGDADHAAAIPVSISIERLWMMKNPPFDSPYTRCELVVRVTAPVEGLATGVLIESGARVARGGFTRSMWRLVLDDSLADLTEQAASEFGRVQTALAAGSPLPLALPRLTIVENPPDPARHQVDFGKYHVLAIGIDDYESLPKLKTAISDARAVSDLLSNAYGFETKLLANATRQQLIRTLSSYREKLGPNDNLLVYYAGHGWNDEEANLGYWLPVDADPDDETNWVSNTKITSMLRAMKAKHVMVVSDSCYSGTLTRGVRIKPAKAPHVERLVARRTRLALTSGGNEPVIDGGGGKHSVFANALLRQLRENEDILDATTLHARIREPIMRDSDQTPQFGPIRTARHEDGDFLFVRTD